MAGQTGLSSLHVPVSHVLAYCAACHPAWMIGWRGAFRDQDARTRVVVGAIKMEEELMDGLHGFGSMPVHACMHGPRYLIPNETLTPLPPLPSGPTAEPVPSLCGRLLQRQCGRLGGPLHAHPPRWKEGGGEGGSPWVHTTHTLTTPPACTPLHILTPSTAHILLTPLHPCMHPSRCNAHDSRGEDHCGDHHHG